MKLISLTLKEFKGVTDFTLQLDGKNATVYGENGAGKSSLADAYTFLLTGKNRDGDAFDPFPVDKEGKRKNQGQEPTVEAEFLYDDGDENRFTLTRQLNEKWTKRTGKDEKSYTGDETLCWVDGAPHKIGEYNAFIAQKFCADDMLRILTILGHFNRLESKVQRPYLFDLFGDMTDIEIVNADPTLSELAAEIGNRTVDGYKKMVKAHLSESEKEIEKLDIKIGASAKFLHDEIDVEVAKNKISKIGVELATLRYDLANDKSDPTEDIRRQLSNVEQSIKNENFEWHQYIASNTANHDRQYAEHLRALESELNKYKLDLKDITGNIQRGENCVSQINADIQLKRDLWNAQKKAWDDKNAETFVVDDENCPTCGQTFPAEKIQEMQANWNERKSEKLSQMSAHLSQIQESGKALAVELKKCNDALDGLRQKLEKIQAAHGVAEEQYTQFKASKNPYEPTRETMEDHAAKLKELQATIVELEEQLTSADNGECPDKTVAKERVAELETQLKEQQKLVATAKASEDAQQLMDGYEAKQKELATVRDHAAKMINLCNEFEKAKSNLQVLSINDSFKITRFKLFKDFKTSTEVEPDCITMAVNDRGALVKHGSSQSNRALDFASDMDIIVTFSKALGLSFPIFVDDGEGVFSNYGVTPGDTQCIRLIAIENADGLTVEVEE